MNPVVYSFINKIEKASILLDEKDKYQNYYIESRKGDKRLRFVKNQNRLYIGEIFSYLCVNTKEKLEPIYSKLKKDNICSCVLQQEIGCEDYWLDIAPKDVTKANTILKLKEMLNCEKIIAFGDGANDIDMFKMADECYAVENAVPQLKTIATDIIESNNNNGVAKWLNENVIL